MYIKEVDLFRETMKALIPIIILIAIVESTNQNDPCELGDKSDQIWPSIQASPKEDNYRLVQINWEVDEVQEGDWVGVFNDDPTSFIPTKIYTPHPTTAEATTVQYSSEIPRFPLKSAFGRNYPYGNSNYLTTEQPIGHVETTDRTGITREVLKISTLSQFEPTDQNVLSTTTLSSTKYTTQSKIPMAEVNTAGSEITDSTLSSIIITPNITVTTPRTTVTTPGTTVTAPSTTVTTPSSTLTIPSSTVTTPGTTVTTLGHTVTTPSTTVTTPSTTVTTPNTTVITPSSTVTTPSSTVTNSKSSTEVKSGRKRSKGKKKRKKLRKISKNIQKSSRTTRKNIKKIPRPVKIVELYNPSTETSTIPVITSQSTVNGGRKISKNKQKSSGTTRKNIKKIPRPTQITEPYNPSTETSTIPVMTSHSTENKIYVSETTVNPAIATFNSLEKEDKIVTTENNLNLREIVLHFPNSEDVNTPATQSSNNGITDGNTSNIEREKVTIQINSYANPISTVEPISVGKEIAPVSSIASSVETITFTMTQNSHSTEIATKDSEMAKEVGSTTEIVTINKSDIPKNIKRNKGRRIVVVKRNRKNGKILSREIVDKVDSSKVKGSILRKIRRRPENRHFKNGNKKYTNIRKKRSNDEVIILTSDEGSRFGGGHSGKENRISITETIEEHRFGGAAGTILDKQLFKHENIVVEKNPDEEHRFGGFGLLKKKISTTASPIVKEANKNAGSQLLKRERITVVNDPEEEHRFGGGFDLQNKITSTTMKPLAIEINKIAGGRQLLKSERITVVKDPEEEHRFGGGFGLLNKIVTTTLSPIVKETNRNTDSQLHKRENIIVIKDPKEEHRFGGGFGPQNKSDDKREQVASGLSTENITKRVLTPKNKQRKKKRRRIVVLKRNRNGKIMSREIIEENDNSKIEDSLLLKIKKRYTNVHFYNDPHKINSNRKKRSDNEVIILTSDQDGRFGGGYSEGIDSEKPIFSTGIIEENRFGGGIGANSDTLLSTKENITVIIDPEEENRFGGGYGSLNQTGIITMSPKEVNTYSENVTDSYTTIGYELINETSIAQQESTVTDEPLTTTSSDFIPSIEFDMDESVETNKTKKSGIKEENEGTFFRGYNGNNNSGRLRNNDLNSDKEVSSPLSITNSDESFVESKLKKNLHGKQLIFNVDNLSTDNPHGISTRSAGETMYDTESEANKYLENEYVIDFDYSNIWTDEDQQRTKSKNEKSAKISKNYEKNHTKGILSKSKHVTGDIHDFDYQIEDINSSIDDFEVTDKLQNSKGDLSSYSVHDIKLRKNKQHRNKNPGVYLEKEQIESNINRSAKLSLKPKQHEVTINQHRLNQQIKQRQAKTFPSYSEVSGFDEEMRSDHLNQNSEPSGDPVGWSRYHPWVMFSALPTSTEGKITSTVSQPRVSREKLAEGGCVGVWVAYIRNGRVLMAKCFASYPAWIYDNREVLSEVALQDLAIVGTHNAGSMKIIDEYEPIQNWVVCQDETVLDQLLYGIRHLDIRVGYYPQTSEKLWINHDVVRWTPLSTLLAEVVNFTQLSPDPVIIDIHRTPVGFEHPEAEDVLIKSLEDNLPQLIFPNDNRQKVTLQDIWDAGRSVLVFWGDWETRDQHTWLWPPIPQVWGNLQTVDKLKGFLVSETKKFVEYSQIWAAMGHLTPTFWDIMFRGGNGNRGFADKTASMLVDFTTKTNWTLTGKLLAVDFFHSSNLIEPFIKINIRRQKCPALLQEQITTTTASIFTTSRNNRLLANTHQTTPMKPIGNNYNVPLFTNEDSNNNTSSSINKLTTVSVRIILPIMLTTNVDNAAESVVNYSTISPQNLEYTPQNSPNIN